MLAQVSFNPSSCPSCSTLKFSKLYALKIPPGANFIELNSPKTLPYPKPSVSRQVTMDFIICDIGNLTLTENNLSDVRSQTNEGKGGAC